MYSNTNTYKSYEISYKLNDNQVPHEKLIGINNDNQDQFVKHLLQISKIII